MLDDSVTPEEHEKRINDVLARSFRREVGRGREPVYVRTPLDDLIEAEEGDEDARSKMLGQVLDYFFADGPHPGAVLRRVFGLAKAVRPQLIMHMSLHDLGQMFGDGRAAWSFRIKSIFNGYLKKMTGMDFTLPWQKSPGAVAKYSEAQKGNSNRRHGHAFKDFDL